MPGDRYSEVTRVLYRVLLANLVVAVATAHLPAEDPEFVFERAEIADGGDGGVGLEIVVIDDHRDLGKALVGHRLERLPDLPFLQLTVAGHHEDAAAAAGVAIGARHPVRL